jgi:hypothetical protein
MVNEFDKEMDAILRKARGTETVVSFDSHMDADDISAFAENALPEAVKLNYTAHLADCTRCRKILSNVMALNSEAETETASSIVPAKIAEAKTPWYRKLFVFPQIAYTMGGLVLLFSGFFGYLVLQNLNSASNSDVSRSMDKSEPPRKPLPQTAPTGTLNSNAAPANASKPAANAAAPIANSAANTSDATPFDSTTATANKPAEKPIKLEATPPLTSAQPGPVTTEKLPADDLKTSEDQEAAKLRRERDDDKPNASGAGIVSKEENKTKAKNKKEAASKDDWRTTDELSENRPNTTRSAPDNPAKQNSAAGQRRSVGGKTFNNVGGTWFDSAYGSQKQKTVNRGSGDYQKLDSQLRSIADQLGGTVIIVWKSKAYRIQ